MNNSVVYVLYNFHITFFKKKWSFLFCFVTAAKEGAGAVDEEDFIKAFDDVPVVQVSVGLCCCSSQGSDSRNGLVV